MFPLYRTLQKLHVAAIRRGLGNDGSGYEARIRVLKLIRRRPWEKCDRSEMGVVWGNLTDVTIAVRFYTFWKNGIESKKIAIPMNTVEVKWWPWQQSRGPGLSAGPLNKSFHGACSG